MVGEASGELGDELLLELDTLVCRGPQDGFHAKMASILCSAKLTPLRKKPGAVGALDPFGNPVEMATSADEGIRPIASGETLRRWTGKMMMCKPALKATFKALQPEQLGVGVPSTCPLIATAVRQVVKNLLHRGKTDWAILRVE